jgi:hypothetical protein
MPRWRVDYTGTRGQYLGRKDEKSAIAEAAKEFNIPPARQNKIAVTNLANKK